MHILIVDSMRSTANFAETALGKGEQPHEVDVVPTYQKAIELIEGSETAPPSKYEVIIIGEWVTNLLKTLRAMKITTPVVSLQSSDDLAKQVSFYESGGDEYIVVPISPALFRLKVEAIARRARGFSRNLIEGEYLTVDLNARNVIIDKKPYALSPQRYALLEYLALRKGGIVTAEEIEAYLHKSFPCETVKVTASIVSGIRRSLALSKEECPVKNVWGQGYLFALKEDSQ